MRFIAVSKAPRKAAYRAINSVQDLMSGAVTAVLSRGIRAFRSGIDREKIQALLERDNVEGVYETIPWGKLGDNISGMSDQYEQAIRRGGKIGTKFIPRVKEPELDFSPKNPRVGGWINSRTANLVQNITEDAKVAIRGAVTRALNRGINPLETAKLIPRTIGLTDRQAQAVDNFRIGLANKLGIEGLKLEREVEKYRERLLDYRTENIARTEIAAAFNQGQIELWEQAAEKGYLDRGSQKKQWVIDPGTACQICEPMSGEEVLLTEQFYVEGLSQYLAAPPAHPSCNCDVVLS